MKIIQINNNSNSLSRIDEKFNHNINLFFLKKIILSKIFKNTNILEYILYFLYNIADIYLTDIRDINRYIILHYNISSNISINIKRVKNELFLLKSHKKSINRKHKHDILNNIEFLRSLGITYDFTQNTAPVKRVKKIIVCNINSLIVLTIDGNLYINDSSFTKPYITNIKDVVKCSNYYLGLKFDKTLIIFHIDIFYHPVNIIKNISEIFDLTNIKSINTFDYSFMAVSYDNIIYFWLYNKKNFCYKDNYKRYICSKHKLAIFNNDDSLSTIGDNHWGGNAFFKNVKSFYYTNGSCCVLTNDDTIKIAGINNTNHDINDVEKVYTCDGGYLALKKDKSILIFNFTFHDIFISKNEYIKILSIYNGFILLDSDYNIFLYNTSYKFVSIENIIKCEKINNIKDIFTTKLFLIILKNDNTIIIYDIGIQKIINNNYTDVKSLIVNKELNCVYIYTHKSKSHKLFLRSTRYSKYL